MPKCFKCLNASSQKTTKSELRKKVTKINLWITAKSHSHLQTLIKTPAKLQKDLTQLKEELLRSQDFDGQSETEHTGKNNMSLGAEWWGGGGGGLT